MASRRLLPLACAAWMSSIFLVAPRADDRQPVASRAANPHLDLTLFTHSENCVACHNNLVTPTGDDVSIGSTWRSTMMANSARDPYWQAAVRRETLDHPQHSAAIQDECAACHMPMSQRITKAAGGTGEVFAQLPSAGATAPSCTGWPPTASRARSAIRWRPIGSARRRASTPTSS